MFQQLGFVLAAEFCRIKSAFNSSEIPATTRNVIQIVDEFVKPMETKSHHFRQW